MGETPEPTDPATAADGGHQKEEGDAARRTLWRRPSTWALLAVVVAAGGIAVWLLLSGDSETVTEPAQQLNFVEVERTTLEDVTTLDGTLGFVAGDPLIYAGSPEGIVTISAGSPGPLTSLPEEGSTIEAGGVLFTVDEEPVVAFYGEIPAYRPLSTRSTDGSDVLQLEEALVRLGYDEDGDLTLDGDFTYATKNAIRALQDDLGVDDTGILALGSYEFVDGPVYVAETTVDVGSAVNPGVPVIATSTTPTGTVTEVADEGDILDHGDTMFRLEGDPVTLFVTDVPFYRTLDLGSTGDDVRVLEASLSEFGFDADGDLTVDGTFDEATGNALMAWQRSIDAPVDGVLNIGEVMVTEDPIRIANSHISVGSTVKQGTQIFTPSTSTSVVSVRLPAEDQELLILGDPVNVIMPNGDDEPATVTSVGSVAIRSQEFGTYFEVEITLANQGAAAGLDEAPVDVEAINDRAENVLAVPVTALLALAEGGYAVEVDAGDGTTTLVGVDVGMYADGSVEIISDQIDAGTRVVVP
jgi:peptidoglycan hydrolase-like protein with peptidoglycan-binding domain